MPPGTIAFQAVLAFAPGDAQPRADSHFIHIGSIHDASAARVALERINPRGQLHESSPGCDGWTVGGDNVQDVPAPIDAADVRDRRGILVCFDAPTGQLGDALVVEL